MLLQMYCDRARARAQVLNFWSKVMFSMYSRLRQTCMYYYHRKYIHTYYSTRTRKVGTMAGGLIGDLLKVRKKSMLQHQLQAADPQLQAADPQGGGGGDP